MTPFYQRLPNVAGFAVGEWVDPVGLGLTGLVAAAATVHGVTQVVRHHHGKASSEKTSSDKISSDKAPSAEGAGGE
jgi:hypothetical protein